MDDSRFATWFAMALRARGHLGTADFNDSFAAVMLDSKQFDSIGEKTEKDLEQRQIAALQNRAFAFVGDAHRD